MKLSLLLFVLQFASLSASYAQTAPAPQVTEDAVPDMVQLTGRGIQNEDSGEAIFLACTDTQNLCRRLRILQVKDQKTPVWLGQSFPTENTVQVREDLKKWYKERRIEDIFLFLKNPDYTYAFTQKNGWNWSNSPLKLSKKDFANVSSTLIYYATYQHAAESEKSIVAIPEPVASAPVQPETQPEPAIALNQPQFKLIAKPTLSGLYFSDTSDPNGICRTQGFQKEMPGSRTTSGDAVGAVVIVNGKGQVSKGEIITSEKGSFISQIMCVGPLENKIVNDIPKIVNRPTLSSFYLSSGSDLNGVCRAIGFERTAIGTVKTNGDAVGSTLIVNSDATISKGEIVTAKSGSFVEQLVCVNPQPAIQPEKATRVRAPKLQGLSFSSSSASNGICRALGFTRSALDTIFTDGSAIGSTVIVNESGTVTGSDIITSAAGTWILEITCLSPNQ